MIMAVVVVVVVVVEGKERGRKRIW